MKKQLQQEIEKWFPVMESFFSPKALAQFRDCDEESLWRYHFSFGLWLRNTLLIGEGWLTMFAEKGMDQKDDMSTYIIQLFQQYLREKTDNPP